jgi:hypothetical protein
VKAKDPSYTWKLRQTVKGSGYTAYLIDHEVAHLAQPARRSTGPSGSTT